MCPAILDGAGALSLDEDKSVNEILIFLLKGTSLLKELVDRWKQIGCAGHFESHHKWWQVLLFWALVALAVLAFLALRD